jgi:hypothetical protein
MNDDKKIIINPFLLKIKTKGEYCLNFKIKQCYFTNFNVLYFLRYCTTILTIFNQVKPKKFSFSCKHKVV